MKRRLFLTLVVSTIPVFARDTNEVKLDQIMDKQKIGPGTYLIDVVAHLKTSRLVFAVTGRTETTGSIRNRGSSRRKVIKDQLLF